MLVTLMDSFPSLINVSSLLSLVVFLYAILGVDLFTFVRAEDAITLDRNFHSLANAGLLLFQVCACPMPRPHHEQM